MTKFYKMRIGKDKETRWNRISSIILLLTQRRHFESSIVDTANATHAQIPECDENKKKMADELELCEEWFDTQVDFRRLKRTHETVSPIFRFLPT